MCECCGHAAQNYQHLLYVQSIEAGQPFDELKKTLGSAPGIINLEHLPNSKEAKVIFDTRIMSSERLQKILNLLGYLVYN